MRVLIVDDSVIFRSQISASLTGVADIEVVGTAPSGAIALSKITQVNPDIITLDVEMPEMDGIEVLKKIREQKFPVKVIMFSSQTTRGAEKALDALRAGADDVVAKPTLNAGETASDAIKKVLVPKIQQFMNGSRLDLLQTPINLNTPHYSPVEKKDYTKVNIDTFKPEAIVIASSTGGPPALESIFDGFQTPLKIPILIVQHMPPVFTTILAKRIQDISGIPCKEGQDGEEIKPGHIYIAPGDYHMELGPNKVKPSISINQGPQKNSVRPAADLLFESAANIYSSRLLGIVLTGMGEDGMLGCRYVKNQKGAVVIQNKESCVVFGMPGAVFNDATYDAILSLNLIRSLLKKYI